MAQPANGPLVMQALSIRFPRHPNRQTGHVVDDEVVPFASRHSAKNPGSCRSFSPCNFGDDETAVEGVPGPVWVDDAEMHANIAGQVRQRDAHFHTRLVV